MMFSYRTKATKPIIVEDAEDTSDDEEVEDEVEMEEQNDDDKCKRLLGLPGQRQ